MGCKANWPRERIPRLTEENIKKFIEYPEGLIAG
jgi:hypothetical protein